MLSTFHWLKVKINPCTSYRCDFLNYYSDHDIKKEATRIHFVHALRPHTGVCMWSKQTQTQTQSLSAPLHPHPLLSWHHLPLIRRLMACSVPLLSTLTEPDLPGYTYPSDIPLLFYPAINWSSRQRRCEIGLLDAQMMPGGVKFSKNEHSCEI